MTALTPLASAEQRRPQRSQRFRLDIQALRALAIALVAINHLWPARLPGGYVGVDVFFVISGYLITAHLFAEVAATGGIRLGQFYARRIRRLLPAALLVLAVSAVLVAVFLPYPQWARNAAELAGSAAYVENWILAALAVNYSAVNDAATVAQHYWSLSVEEQFYLLWPVLLLGGLWLIGRRRRKVSSRRRAFALLAVVAALSLAASILYTVAQPAQAYFATFTRAWEFALGGLIALAGHRLAPRGMVAGLMAAGGFVAILAAAVWFGSETPFPGWAALLPVVGTGAIILAGTRGGTTWHTPVTSSGPVQWLGEISYSLYLWHWPLIVVAPFVLRAELTTMSKLGILATAVALAAFTKTFVEDPGRRAKVWNGSVRRSLAGMGAGMLVVFVAAAGLYAGSVARDAAESPDAALPVGSCVGPGAIHDVASCPDAFGPAVSTVMTRKNSPFFSPPECQETADLVFGDRKTTRLCDFSADDPEAVEVWLVGDSHAEHWQGAVFELAQKHRWRVTVSLFGGCPAADVAFVGFRGPASPAEGADCRAWGRAVSDRIVRDRPDAVLTSMAARLQLVDDGSGRSQTDQFVGGLVRDWMTWADAGVSVFPIGDPPLNGEVRTADCVALHSADPLECARPRELAHPSDPLMLAAAAMDHDDVHPIDLTSNFCDEKLCYAVIGGEPVYYDADHLNLRFTRMLVPQLDRALSEHLASTAG